MKVVMILPPTATIANAALSILSIPLGGKWSLFIDMQAEVTELDMQRHLVEHPIPGKEGGSLQDIGSQCSVLSIKGKWIYENKPDEDIIDLVPALQVFGGAGWNWIRVQLMQVIYRLKEPLFIGCNLISSAFMIDKMKFKEVGGKPNVYDYHMVVKEFNPLLGIIGGVTTTVIGQGSGY